MKHAFFTSILLSVALLAGDAVPVDLSPEQQATLMRALVAEQAAREARDALRHELELQVERVMASSSQQAAWLAKAKAADAAWAGVCLELGVDPRAMRPSPDFSKAVPVKEN